MSDSSTGSGGPGRSVVGGVTGALDWLLDKAVVPGYSAIGPAVRRLWWPSDPDPGALRGRHVLITGASGGLGLAAAAGIADLGATVHLTGRTLERLERARTTLLRERPGRSVRVWENDVSDLDDVERFAAAFATEVPRLAALVHNAGVMPPERSETAQGHERALATHVLGPQVLTHRLAGVLSGGRVVLVTSGGMYTTPLVEDYEFREGTYSGTTAYARTKRMQVVQTRLLADELAPAGILVASMHPGWADTPGVTESIPGFKTVMGPILRSPESGADTIVWLVGTDLDWPTGRLWSDRRVRSETYGPGADGDPEAEARFAAYLRAETTDHLG